MWQQSYVQIIMWNPKKAHLNLQNYVYYQWELECES